MKKKDYRPEIHALFEQMRSELNVNNAFFIPRMEMLEMREKYMIDSATKENFQKLKAEIRKNKQKQKTYKLPFAGKKYTVLPSGKIKVENLKTSIT